VLHRETAQAAQGALEMWVDVLTLDEARLLPFKEIALAPPEDFELRLIVYETRRLRKLGTIRSMDAYFKIRLDGHGGPLQMHESDVHWGVVDGCAVFNWRFLFRLTLPLSAGRSAAMHGVHLDVQVWDHALIGAGEIIAAARVDLSKLCARAWREREELKAHDRTLPLEVRGEPRFWLALGAATAEGATDALNPVVGEMAVSLELMPIEVAKKRPAGSGRDPPNRNPVLPEPQRARTKAFSDRFTSIMRDEFRTSMAESAKQAIQGEISNQQRQLTPERLWLVRCSVGVSVCLFLSVIAFQLAANVIVCVVFAQNAAAFEQAFSTVAPSTS
jgi:hypothetical protein